MSAKLDITVLTPTPCKHPRQDDLDAIARTHRLVLEVGRQYWPRGITDLLQRHLAKLYATVRDTE